ncbi:hypothetical protein BJX76DRAFT_147138 [Aspergillus varians]
MQTMRAPAVAFSSSFLGGRFNSLGSGRCFESLGISDLCPLLFWLLFFSLWWGQDELQLDWRRGVRRAGTAGKVRVDTAHGAHWDPVLRWNWDREKGIEEKKRETKEGYTTGTVKVSLEGKLDG